MISCNVTYYYAIASLTVEGCCRAFRLLNCFILFIVKNNIFVNHLRRFLKSIKLTPTLYFYFLLLFRMCSWTDPNHKTVCLMGFMHKFTFAVQKKYNFKHQKLELIHTYRENTCFMNEPMYH